MAFNFLEVSKSAINKSTIEQMANALDLNEDSMASAVQFAIPALVGGLIKKAQTADGASELFAMLELHDGSLLGNLGELFIGGKHQMLMDVGQKILPTLFGDNLPSIISTTAKPGGIGSANARSVLEILAPIMMSVLGKQKKAAGWDVGRFSSVLMSQNERTTKPAMESKKAPEKRIQPGSGRKILDIADRTGASHSESVRAKSGQTAQVGGSLFKVVTLLLIAVALSFLVWKFLLAPPPPQPNQGQPNSSTSATGDSGSQSGNDSGDGSSLARAKDMFRNVTAILESVKDEATAKNAATRLNELSGKIDGIGLEKLDGMARSAFQVAVKAFRSKVNEMLDQVYRKPGVEPILKPAVEAFLNKFGGD